MRAATTPNTPQRRPGRWRALALAIGLGLYATAIVAMSAICIAMSWKAGLP